VTDAGFDVDVTSLESALPGLQAMKDFVDRALVPGLDDVRGRVADPRLVFGGFGSGADIGGEAVATPAGGPHGATSGSMMPSGGGLSGLGAFGGVGAAGAGTSGSGVVGVAAGGTGALGAGLGTAVSPAFGGVPLPLGGSGAARPGARSGGAAAKGAGPLGGMPGPVGSAAQRSARGEDADRSTWLLEDEDVWGTDSGAPPSVLGREKP
jgi:hypothetical protein